MAKQPGRNGFFHLFVTPAQAPEGKRNLLDWSRKSSEINTLALYGKAKNSLEGRFFQATMGAC
jgi:hypothetical protein